MDASMPSDTHLEHLKSITTLRNGKEIDKTFYWNLARVEAPKPSIMNPKNLEPLSGESEGVSRKEEEEKVPCPMPTPFPQRFWEPKKGTTNAKIYKLFEQVKINIPLLDAIKQIHAYAKFLKDLFIVKRTMQVQKKAFLMEEASSIIQTKTTPK